jgi:anti-sigma regulatory factor (Ser/Thr protein kinase)
MTEENPPTGAQFAMRFTSTPRGARLARRLVSERLAAWGHPYDSVTNESMTLITAELAANAVRHGHVPGRGFHVGLRVTGSVVRVEVTDTRSERQPPQPPPPSPVHTPFAESGRGLFLVSQLATRWAVSPRPDRAPGKTVWAELNAVQTSSGPRFQSVSGLQMARDLPGVDPATTFFAVEEGIDPMRGELGSHLR